MGKFVNPDNSAFQVALNSKIYVDKTGLLAYTNSCLNTDNAFICNSRPRRFGKSITANMLAAYYSKGCDSESMFSGLAIHNTPDFKKHLNQYDVIHFDVQWCMMDAGSARATVSYINDNILAELKESYPDIPFEHAKTVYGAMSDINQACGKKFVVIIDEWDVLIRDEASQTVQTEYINFLRGMFKGTLPTKFIALAFLTGILPIKKIRTQSTLNNFDKFTMITPDAFAPFIGFTEDEVKTLCKKYEKDFVNVKRWYDGYLLDDYQIYNPKAVVNVMTKKGKFKSYWSESGSYETILPLINMNFDGLKTAIIEMLSGASAEVDVTTFQNDTSAFSCKDDVLTYLIHLGYLGYDEISQTAFIPNEELRQELTKATKRSNWNEMIDFWQDSLSLLNATFDMDCDEVSKRIEDIHTAYASSIEYNDENSLSSVLTIGYLSSMQYYYKPVRELPTGRGFADFVFIPKPEYRMEYPALVVELKWNKNAQTALTQIKERNYPASILQYTGDILLVGINYDKKKNVHQCEIEKFEKST